MDQVTWSSMSVAQKDKARDMSDINPQLASYVGKKVRVTPKRKWGYSTFVVGRTTGWKPVLLACRSNASGSSDTISVDERFTSIKVL